MAATGPGPEKRPSKRTSLIDRLDPFKRGSIFAKSEPGMTACARRPLAFFAFDSSMGNARKKS